MKKLTILITLLTGIMFLNSSFADNYQCAYIYNNEAYSNSLERKSEFVFSERSRGGVMDIDVLFENEQFLTLGSMKYYEKYQGYNITIIDKGKLTMRSTTVIEPSNKEDKVAIVDGNCVLY